MHNIRSLSLQSERFLGLAAATAAPLFRQIFFTYMMSIYSSSMLPQPLVVRRASIEDTLFSHSTMKF